MEKNKEPKHVYIFGNEYLGFLGHSYYKEDAKKIKETRKNLKMFKIKNDKYCKDALSVNTEFLSCYKDAFVTADEEEYFLEAFNQFHEDVARTHIDDLIRNLKYFKFSKKEKPFIKYLVNYLCDYQDYIIRGQYEDDIDIDYDEMYDREAALKWFVENVLD